MKVKETTSKQTIRFSEEYIKAGLSIIPILPDGSKAPAISQWTPYRHRLPTDQEVKEWFSSHSLGIGLICGKISGGIEVIDFDAPGAFDDWADQVENTRPGLLDRLPIVQTPSGYGRHVYLRRNEPQRGTKLARRRAESGNMQVLIETRGEGNYVLVPGCPSECHPSGNTYIHISGPAIEDIRSIPPLDDKDYEILILAARSLNEYFPPETTFKGPPSQGTFTGTRPGDEYNQKTSWKDILEPHGWKLMRSKESVGYWRRPGKEDWGISATTGHCNTSNSGELFYVFSTNAHPFEDGRVYSKFAAFTLLNHGGDFERAARALASKGLGQQITTNMNPIGTTSTMRNSPILLWQPFPTDVIPEPLCSYVYHGARALGCDPAYIALPLLAGLASAIGNTRRIELKNTWKAPSILWALVVAESGTLKSPAMDLALQPIRDAEEAAFSKYQTEMKAYEEQKTFHEACLGDWKRDKKRTVAPPDPPTEPTCTRYMVSDVTIEALAPLLYQNPRGLLLTCDELSGWLGSFDAYKNSKGSDVAHWLEFHRGGALTVDRKSGQLRTIHVPRAAVSITGTIQPGVLRDVLTQKYFDNGLVARLLLAMPPRISKRWTECAVPQDVLDQTRCIVHRLLQLKLDPTDDSYAPISLPLSSSAKARWVKWYDRHAEAQSTVEGPLAAAFSKIEEQPARFALIFSLVHHAVKGPVPSSGISIDEGSMQCGIVLADWFVRETERIYGMFAETGEERGRRQLVEYIQRQGRRITARELSHGPRQYRGEGGIDKAKDALQALVDAGFGHWETHKPVGPGRPSEVFILEKSINVDPCESAPRGIVEPEPLIVISSENTPFPPPDHPDLSRIVEPLESQKPENHLKMQTGVDTSKEVVEEDKWGEI